MRVALALSLVAVTLAVGFAPVPPLRPKKPESGAERVVRAIEGFRKTIPPAVGMAEQDGLSVKELEPYLMSHLAGVARRLGAKTRAECVALLPYVADRDYKVRYIAQQALNGATEAYPHGMSVEWFLDTTSEGHREMARRFEELVARMPR